MVPRDLPVAARPSWRRKLLFAAITTVLFLVVLLVGLELVLWLDEGWRPLDGMHAGALYTWGHIVERNALGFREREIEVPKPAGVTRVMVLGDSLTWGVGVAAAARYTGRLEQALQVEPGREVEVLSFGLSGASTARELEVLEAHVTEVDPDLVLVGWCVNDPLPMNQGLYGRERWSWLLRGLHALRRAGLPRSSAWLVRRTLGVLESLGLVPDRAATLARIHDTGSSEWRACRAALAGLRQRCADAGLPAPVLALLVEGPRLEAEAAYYQQAASAAAGLGFVVVDCTDPVRELAVRPGARLVVDEREQHPSPDVHAAWARCLTPALRQRLESLDREQPR